jgi:hypothetical protein
MIPEPLVSPPLLLVVNENWYVTPDAPSAVVDNVTVRPEIPVDELASAVPMKLVIAAIVKAATQASGTTNFRCCIGEYADHTRRKGPPPGRVT